MTARFESDSSMFDDTNLSSSEGESRISGSSYLNMARGALDSGDDILAMHLYVAAFEKYANESDALCEDAMDGLKEAWGIACSYKERSMAEYIFERMEPFLSNNEVEACTNTLQSLAFASLEQFGISPEDLQGVQSMIAGDFGGMHAQVLHVGPGRNPLIPDVSDMPGITPDQLPPFPAFAGQMFPMPQAPQAQNTVDAKASAADQSVADQFATGVGAPSDASALELSNQAASTSQNATEQRDDNATSDLADILPSMPTVVKVPSVNLSKDMRATFDGVNFSGLVGYDNAIEMMQRFGIGVDDDPAFQYFVECLNKQHGLDRMPAPDSMIFRSIAREDAFRFMAAAVRELDLPVIRMRVDEGLQGVMSLCVMTQSDRTPKLNKAKNAFAGPGILVLEDLDYWTAPPQPQEPAEGLGGFMMAQMSRGAQEAINLIKSAVDRPDVYVFATMQADCEVDPFFCDLVEPLTVIDIEPPTEDERRSIWKALLDEHPSMSDLDIEELVRYSAFLPRADIYYAVREAIEQMYKEGLYQRQYIPVTRDVMLGRLADCQPIDSDEYRAIESAVLSSFADNLDNDFEQLLQYEDLHNAKALDAAANDAVCADSTDRVIAQSDTNDGKGDDNRAYWPAWRVERESTDGRDDSVDYDSNEIQDSSSEQSEQ